MADYRVDAPVDASEVAPGLDATFDRGEGPAENPRRLDAEAMRQGGAAIGPRHQFDDADQPAERAHGEFASTPKRGPSTHSKGCSSQATSSPSLRNLPCRRTRSVSSGPVFHSTAGR